MRLPRRSLLGVIACTLPAAPAVAQVATFEVDPAVSSLSASGTVSGAPIQQQGPGSLTTSYTGPIPVILTPDSIHFPGGGSVKANDSGTWQPAPGGGPGSAPANYGGQATILFVVARAALRNAIFDASGLQPLPLAAGAFDPAVTITGLQGEIDYNAPFITQGSQSIVGSAAPNESTQSGMLSIVPGPNDTADASILLPLDFTLVTTVKGIGDVVMDLTGSMTARATAAAGDANFDGRVNLADFNILASSFGASSGQSWLSGDFNFDGLVNLADFNLLAGNFGLSAAGTGVTAHDWAALGSAVPEPAGAGVLLLVSAALASRRRR